jgi:WD40 repeat protein
VIGLILGGVALLLLVIVGVGVAFYAFSGDRDIPTAEWQTFSVPGGGASISMPGTPMAQDAPLGRPDWKKYILQRDDNRKGFVFLQWDGPPVGIGDNLLESNFTEARANLVRAANARVIREGEVQIKGHPGREAEFQTQESIPATIILRLYMVRLGGKCRFYELVTEGPTMKAGSADVSRFFDSFQIDAPAPGEPEPVNSSQPRPSSLEKPAKPDEVPEEIGNLRAHGQNVWGLSFAPDGKLLATGGGDSSLKLWQLDGWKEQLAVPGHAGAVGGVAFSRDGTHLAVHAGCTVYLYDATGKRETSFPVRWNGTNQATWIMSLAFSPDGKMLAVGCQRMNQPNVLGEIHFWDVKAGKEAPAVQAHVGGVLALAYSSDGKTLATAGTDQVKLWDAQTMGERHTLEGHIGEIRAVAFAPGDKIVASAGADRTIRLWKTASGAQQQILEGHTDRVTRLAFSRDGAKLVSGSADGTVRVWNVEKGEQQAVFALTPGQEIRSLAFGAETLLAAGLWDGRVKVWDASKALAKTTPVLPLLPTLTAKGPDEIASFQADPRGASVLQFSRIDETLFIGGNETLRRWELPELKHVAALPAHVGPINALAVSRDGRSLAVSATGDRIYLRDGATGKLQRTLKVVSEGPLPAVVNCLAFAPDGKILAVGFHNPASPPNTGQLTLWDLESFREVKRTRPSAAEGLSALAFSSDGKTLVSAGHVVKVWDAQTLEERQVLREHNGPVRDLAFSPNGSVLATSGDDRLIRLWDPATWKEVRRPLEGHSQAKVCLAFSSDGKWLASGSGDGTMRVWDVATGDIKTWRKLPPATFPFSMCLAFSRDDKMLAALRGNETKVWDFEKLLKSKPAPLLPTTVQDPQKPELVAHVKPAGTEVAGVRFSPDGSTLAIGYFDGTLKLYDTADFRERANITGQGFMHTIDFSKDGKKMAVAGTPLISLRDGVSGKLELTLNQLLCHCEDPLLEGHVFALAPDGKTVALRVGGLNNPKSDVVIWDFTRSKEIGKFRPQERILRALAYAPDGATLATACDNVVKLWDVETLKPRVVLEGPLSHVAAVAFSPDGKVVAAGGFDKLIRLWNAANGKQLHTLEGHRNTMVDVAFSPDGKLLCSTAVDGTARLWDVKEGTLKAVVGGKPNGCFTAASFGEEGKLLATTMPEDGVRVWDVAKLIAAWKGEPALAKPAKDPQRPELVAGVKADDQDILATLFFPDGKTLATASAEGNLRLFDVPGFEQRALLPGQIPARTVTIASSHDGKKLVVAAGRSIYLRDGPTGRLEYAFRPNRTQGEEKDQAFLKALALSPDGKTLALHLIHPKTRLGAELQLWDMEERKVTAIATVSWNQFGALAYSPDGATLAAADAEGITLLDPATLKSLRSVGEKGTGARALAFTADGKTLAAAGNGPHVLLFDVATGKQTGKVGGVPQGFHSVALSPDGKLVAAGTPQGAVHLFETDTGKPREVFPPLGGSCQALAFSPDGKLLATTPRGGKVEVFEVEKLLQRPVK